MCSLTILKSLFHNYTLNAYTLDMYYVSFESYNIINATNVTIIMLYCTYISSSICT